MRGVCAWEIWLACDAFSYRRCVPSAAGRGKERGMGLGVARGRRNGALPSADASRRNGRRDTMRRTGRAPVGSAVRLAGMRLTHQWRLLLAVALRIPRPVVLICTVPLYNTLVAHVELQPVLPIAQPPER